MAFNRLDDLKTFYRTLGWLENTLGGTHLLLECNGKNVAWPNRGVYFFMENNEPRTNTGDGRRIVRVGTHALTDASKTRLWERLKQHKGNDKNRGGNHRGSIFRKLVGIALDTNQEFPEWGDGNNAQAAVRNAELPLEQRVSDVIRDMPFIWLAVNDGIEINGRQGPELRRYIETNSIALLSNYNREHIDPPSERWLGHKCNRDRVIQSGLWNQNHVDESYAPAFLEALEKLVERMEQGS